jgi:trk system potassium uptake protein TrkH
MNFSIIVYIIGYVLKIEGALMLAPTLVGVYYGESEYLGFGIVAIATFLIGLLLSFKKPKNQNFYAKEAFVSVPLAWIFVSIFGALPFVISGDIPRFIDALFETVSGFTTTGSSILNDVEALSHASLFWRSFSHWIGGMGILVFILSVLPITNGATMHLMRAESPGPQVDKVVPKIKDTSIMLYIIYGAMTVLQMILLIIGETPIFDAVTLSLGTAGTGGFAIKNTGLASYSPYVQYVVAIFMILFGVNFNVYILLLRKHLKQAFKVEEARWYIAIVFLAVALITVNTKYLFPTLEEAFRTALFHVGSMITTTGYATYDYSINYPQFSLVIIVFLMFIGACAGSTGGGLKVSRITIVTKTVRDELARIVHPRAVKKVRSEGKVVEHTVVRSINTYLLAFIGVFALSLLLISLDNFDFTTNFTAVSATINNIGPGLGKVGPYGNFSEFSDFSKLVFCFNMIAGRLEILPMLVLINPKTWSHPFKYKKR